ncbi:hypothetical protein [Aquimarina litoralis]|uniref:hypothetical protein n=1 Tax=Aquimarina litoralis TaxID=584605 RepID=UPI001C566AEA|nr:hypothetical protein [Aquimarina litoralis]MBW1297830.1 hypothetical protein [Aquimarina litoralis]
MSQNNIKPDKITKPIQLLAAWLLGLIILVGVLITAATLVKEPAWLPVFFSISAVLIIPVFLFLIFQLQTRYRPQMQEDQYYSEYLNQNTMTVESEANEELKNSITKTINHKIKELAKLQDKQLIEINDRINSLIPKSDQPIDNFPVSDKFFKTDKTFVNLNQNLEKLDKIEELLNYLNVFSINIFGNNVEHKPPSIFLLSFGEEVDFDFLRVLIKELIPYGLIAIANISSNWRKNDIYIGSYAYRDKYKKPVPILKISDKVLSTMEEFTNTKSFSEYVERNVELLTFKYNS